MTHRLTALCLATLSVAFAASGLAQAQAPEKTFLGYKWEGVASAHYKVTTNEDNTTTTQGKATSTPMTTESEMTLRFLSREKEFTWIEMRLDRLKIVSPSQNLEADSAAAENPKGGQLEPIGKVFAAIREKPLKLLVTPGGRVQRVEGLEGLLQSARAAMPDTPARDQLLGYLVPMRQSDVSDRFATIVLPLPAKHFAAGYTQPVTQSVFTGTLNFTGVSDDGGRKVATVQQTLSASGFPAQSMMQNDKKMSLAIDKIDIASNVAIATDLNIPAKLSVTMTTNKSLRADGADPAAAPESLIQTVRRTETLLVASEAAPPKPAAEATPASGTAPTPPPPAQAAAAAPAAPESAPATPPAQAGAPK